LYEWVPTHLKMTALCTEEELRVLQSIFQGAAIEILEHQPTPVIAKARFNPIQYQYKLKLSTSDVVQKQTVYEELVTAMFKDQLAWIDDRSHARKTNHDNAVNSLKLAEEAELMAVKVSQ